MRLESMKNSSIHVHTSIIHLWEVCENVKWHIKAESKADTSYILVFVCMHMCVCLGVWGMSTNLRPSHL